MTDFQDLRLARLHVGGYGRLQEYTLEPTLAPGILVVAPNEAGKSTLCSAIFRGLFGFPDKAREDLRRPWSGGPYRVTMEWACGDDVRCVIDRDFESQLVSVEWRRIVPGAREPVLERRWEGQPNPRGRSSDRAIYDGHLRRLLGFASGEVFRQTAYVGPGDPGVRPLATELLRLLSGSERMDFRAALVEFETGYYDLTQLDIRGGSRQVKQKPRRLEELAAERAELLRRGEGTRATREARRSAEEALRATRERLARIEEELGDRGRAAQAIQRLSAIRREIADAEKRQAELDRALGGFVEWERQVRDKTAELEPLVRYLRQPRDFGDRMRRVKDLAERRARIAAETDSERKELMKERSPWFERLAGAAGLALLVATAVLAALGNGTAAAGAAAAGAALAAWSLGLRWRRRARRQRIYAHWKSVQEETRRIEAEEREAMNALPAGFDERDPEGEVERFEAAQRIKVELDALQSARKALGDREQVEIERLVVKEERLDVLRLEQRKLLEAHPYLDWGPDYERQFAIDHGRLEDERARLQGLELNQRRALADVRGGEEDPLRLEARILEVEAEIERLSLERDAHRLAYDTLSACKDDFLRVMTVRLQQRISRVFEEMTGGRYDTVEVDPLSLELTVHGVEKRGVPAEGLSRGTRDQLYFAIRVAILEELSSDRALPIILDDPFLHFDRERLARVEETLSRLGESHQILLFTHDARLAGWDFPKQVLPAPVRRAEVPSSS
jgi:ABC-type cobalamin/Fe3+-siderophores transport system ATPase subunit